VDSWYDNQFGAQPMVPDYMSQAYKTPEELALEEAMLMPPPMPASYPPPVVEPPPEEEAAPYPPPMPGYLPAYTQAPGGYPRAALPSPIAGGNAPFERYAQTYLGRDRNDDPFANLLPTPAAERTPRSLDVGGMGGYGSRYASRDMLGAPWDRQAERERNDFIQRFPRLRDRMGSLSRMSDRRGY
jgi:hypothetical protein